MRPKRLPVAAILAAAAIALALVVVSGRASHADERCSLVDFDRLQTREAEHRARWLTMRELDAAKAIWATHQPQGWDYPHGDRGAILDGGGPEGTDLVIFVDGSAFCEVMYVERGARELIEALGAGTVRHAGEGL